MNHSSSRKTMFRSFKRKSGLALGLSLACSLFAGGTQAQVLVTDVAGDASNAATQASTAAAVLKQIDQYIMQAQQYASQLQQYAAIITSIQGMATGGISLMPNTLQPITDSSSLVQQSCPGAGGGGVMGDLTSIVTSAFSQSITTSQQNICAQIVITQVDKYNKTIKVIQDMQQFGSSLQALTKAIGNVTNQGDSNRVSANASVQTQQISADMADWDTQMKADDAVISTLQQQQSILAKVALNGSNTILGNVVQAGAFAAAFH